MELKIGLLGPGASEALGKLVRSPRVPTPDREGRGHFSYEHVSADARLACTLRIADTGGIEGYTPIVAHRITDAGALIFAYSRDSARSLDALMAHCRLLEEVYGGGERQRPPIFLLGMGEDRRLAAPPVRIDDDVVADAAVTSVGLALGATGHFCVASDADFYGAIDTIVQCCCSAPSPSSSTDSTPRSARSDKSREPSPRDSCQVQ